MFRPLLTSRIPRATVTGCALRDEDSRAIDARAAA